MAVLWALAVVTLPAGTCRLPRSSFQYLNRPHRLATRHWECHRDLCEHQGYPLPLASPRPPPLRSHPAWLCTAARRCNDRTQPRYSWPKRWWRKQSWLPRNSARRPNGDSSLQSCRPRLSTLDRFVHLSMEVRLAAAVRVQLHRLLSYSRPTFLPWIALLSSQLDCRRHSQLQRNSVAAKAWVVRAVIRAGRCPCLVLHRGWWRTNVRRRPL